MSLSEDTSPRELKELLDQTDTLETALWDFQRDFVWDAKATQELIVSIASNYPAGSILRIRSSRSLFACREFQGAPGLDYHRPTCLVLDGQQRLASLYQAFDGAGERGYFLDISKLLDGQDFEDCLFHLRWNDPKAKSLEEQDVQAERLIPSAQAAKRGASSPT